MAEDQCTVIVAYEVNSEDVHRFLTAWEKANKYLKAQSGFVSTELRQAVSANPPFRFINIAKWGSDDAFRTATQSIGFHEASGQLAPYPVYASVYEVVRS